MGPEGILASNISVLLHLTQPACPHRNGDRAESRKYYDRYDPCSDFQLPLVSSSAPAEGLQHAPDSVIEVQAKRTHGHDIEERNRPEGKRCYHVLVNR